MKPHYFFAAVIPDFLKKAIHEEMSKRQYPFKKFTHPEDYHITLAFIGSAETSVLEEACSRIKNSLQQTPAFVLQPTSFGTFGSKTAPRVFWVGTDEPKPLFEVQRKVGAACREAGLSIDEKPFRPHITTARKWENPDRPYKEKKAPDLPAFCLDEIALFQTEPFAEPRYQKRWSCRLKNSGEENVNGAIN